MPLLCPCCGAELTADQVKALWASLGGSKKTARKSAASAANGAKGGRPKKINDLSTMQKAPV